MNIKKLEEFLVGNNLPKFRLAQIKKAVFQDGVLSFSEITIIPKDLRGMLENNLNILSFEVEQVLEAKDEQSIKALLRLKNCHSELVSESKRSESNKILKQVQDDAKGDLIETVLISPKPGVWSACISCQVGCQMGCRFCATGKMGFRRNLTTEEITDQILFWRQYLKASEANEAKSCVNNIVFMGMGEPFNNWQNVSESIKILTDKDLFGFGSRSLSVSTSGVAEGIVRMAKEFPQVNLALSLHFANDEKRSRFMPVNLKDDMSALKKALQEYFQITKRKVFLEYIMLDGINDTALDARQLAEYIKSIGNKHLLHVNLIRYNITSDPPAGGLKPSTKDNAMRFKNSLEKLGIHATIRKSLGDEIKGACGQLAGTQ